MPKATITLPYASHLAKSIRRILAPLDVRGCFCLHRKLRQSLVQLKDCTPSEKKAGVVYYIPCGTCGRAYIGQKGRTLNQGLKEHKRALASGNLAQPAIAEHAMEEMHVIDWKEAQVVDSHPHYTPRCTLEEGHIRLERNKLNRDVGPLPSTYTSHLFILTPLSHAPHHLPHT